MGDRPQHSNDAYAVNSNIDPKSVFGKLIYAMLSPDKEDRPESWQLLGQQHPLHSLATMFGADDPEFIETRDQEYLDVAEYLTNRKLTDDQARDTLRRVMTGI